jgi:predicted lactoylglutathione lyase
MATSSEIYVAFTATSKVAVDNAYTAALANGGADNRPPGPRPQFSNRYYAATVLDPDGYSLEICFKPWLYDG